MTHCAIPGHLEVHGRFLLHWRVLQSHEVKADPVVIGGNRGGAV